MSKIERKIQDMLEEKRANIRAGYYGSLQTVEDRERQIKHWLATLKQDGICLVSKDDALRIDHYFGISLYDLLAEKCREWHRPYVKCVTTSYRRNVVIVSGTGVERGLVAHMLISAVPITPKLGRNRKTFEETIQTPNLIENTGMDKTFAPLSQWTTARTIGLVFEDDEGMKLYREWKEFCLTNQTKRIILGIQGERHA